MDKITMFLALKLYSHHQNKRDLHFLFAQTKLQPLPFFLYYLWIQIKESLYLLELNFNFNFANCSLKSLEKIEFHIVWLKLQRFNSTVEKIILNKKIILIQ